MNVDFKTLIKYTLKFNYNTKARTGLNSIE